MAVNYSEDHPTAQDGTRLYLQRWAPPDRPPRAELLVLHGYFEHGGRYRALGHALAARSIATSALDYRGHGHAEGARGYVREFERYHDDVDVAVASMARDHPRFLLGHSHGGLLALDYVARNGPRVTELTGLIVTNPYLDIATEVPAYKVWLGNTMAKLYPRFAVPVGLIADGLSRQEGVREAYERDPLVFTSATAGWFVESNAAQRRVRALRTLPLPVFYIYSDADPVTSYQANHQLAVQLESDKTLLIRHGELHEVLQEIDREELFSRIADWIEERI